MREPQGGFILKCAFHSVDVRSSAFNAVERFSADSFANVMEPMLPLHVVDPSGSCKEEWS